MTQEPIRGVVSCDEIREVMSARMDAEATEAECETLEEHLHHCAACTAYESEMIRIQSQLKEEQFVGFDSEYMWKRVQAVIDDLDDTDDNSPEPISIHQAYSGYKGWLAGVALAACLIISVTVGSVLLVSPQQQQLPLVAETLRDFETFILRGELLDIDNSDSVDVVQWMSAKVDFSLPGTLYPPPEFQIIGGRLCSFLSRRLAFFQYQKNREELSLYVMEAKGLMLPDSGEYQASTTEKGLTTVTWTRDDLAYVIVSELPATEVVEFASRT